MARTAMRIRGARRRSASGRRRAGSCALRASRSFYTCRSSFYCDCLRGRRGRVTVGVAVGYAAWRPRRPAPGACVYTMRMRLGRLVASDHTVSRTGARCFPRPAVSVVSPYMHGEMPDGPDRDSIPEARRDEKR